MTGMDMDNVIPGFSRKMTHPSYKECLKKIYKLGRFGIKLELDTIAGILDRLGSPQQTFRSVHIAGTNGKGSIGAYISSILSEAGFYTGLYTSPHLVKFNERIAVNGETVSDDEVVEACLKVFSADTGDRNATFFEIATAMAFYLFSKRKVEIAVVETGMGGRFDATNIIRPEVSIISNLSIEHTDYLGNTINALAKEKGGIIKPHAPVVTGITQPSAREVVNSIAAAASVPVYIYRKDFSTRKHRGDVHFSYSGIRGTRLTRLKTNLKGDHQRENAALAIAACELISGKNGSENSISGEHIRMGLQNTRWAGRLDYMLENPCVIVDGAHNRKAARLLADHLRSHVVRKGRNLTLVIGILNDKPYAAMLKNLVPLADRIIMTKAGTERSIDPEVLKTAAHAHTTVEITTVTDVGDACDLAINTSKKTDTVCICGSLYVAGEAREKIEADLKTGKCRAAHLPPDG